MLGTTNIRRAGGIFLQYFPQGTSIPSAQLLPMLEMVGPLSQWQVLVLTTQHVDLTLRLKIKVQLASEISQLCCYLVTPQLSEDRVKQDVCDLGQHGLRQEVPLNTCPHQPE